MTTRYKRPYTDAEEVPVVTPRIRQNQRTEDVLTSQQKKKNKSRSHFVEAMILGVIGSFVLLLYASPTVQYVGDQWQYGNARTSEFLFDVGHGGTSRFLASYYHGSVYITEYAHNADPGYEHTYSFQAPGNDQTRHVVTLEKRVIHGHQNLIVQIESIPVEYVLSNTGSTFQMTLNEEEI